MKREIKFRGKSKANGEWFVGLPEYDNTGDIGFISGFPDGGFWVKESKEIVKTTVGQFTGMKDEQGIDIYEGDILAVPEFYETPEMKNTRYFNHQVVFEYGAFHMAGKEVNVSEDDYNLFQESRNYDERFRVVGNIHDNPELLT